MTGINVLLAALAGVILLGMNCNEELDGSWNNVYAVVAAVLLILATIM